MYLRAIILSLLLTAVPVLAHRQSYASPTRMAGGTAVGNANLTQDVALLKQQLGEMRFELERLLRENQAQELRIKQLEAQTSSHVSDGVLRQELSTLRTEINRLSKTQREELLTQITKQIKALVSEAGLAGTSATSAASSNRITEFNDNHPKTGIFYKVQSGDSLSKIASKHGSRISYIIHANKIPNPDKLTVGQELFIPIENP